MWNPPIEATGDVARSTYESRLRSRNERDVLAAAEAKAIPVEAAEAHRGAMDAGDRQQIREATLDILELMIHRGNSVRLP